MMDIFGQIYGYAYKSICNITTGWPFKLAGGAVLLIVARHAALFTAFSLLVALDLFAKFIALSYSMVKAQGAESPSLLDSIKAIPEAHRQRIINSHEMKTQFVGKIIVYILAVIAAAVRSDALHTAYRALKAQVQAAETVDDVATIVWPED